MCSDRHDLRIRDASDPTGFAPAEILEENTIFDIRHEEDRKKRTSVSLVRFETPEGEKSRLLLCNEWNLSDKPKRDWLYPYDAVPVDKVIAFIREHPKATINATSRRRPATVAELLFKADGRAGRAEEIRKELYEALADAGVQVE